MSEYQPEGCKLLVKVEEVKEKTDGGLYIPDTVRENEQLAATTGEVIAIGPAVDLAFAKDRPVKIGDRVIFAKYGGRVIDDKGGLRIINDEDVLARVT